MHVIAPISSPRLTTEQVRQTAGNRFDRRQRVIQFVAQDAQQALPGSPLFFAERLT